MATRHQVQVVTQWTFRDGVWKPDVPMAGNITDITGQPVQNIPPTPNVYLVEMDNLTEAELATVQAHSGCVVLTNESYDDALRSPVSSDKKSRLNATQAGVLKDVVKSKLSDVPDEALSEVRTGVSRDDVVKALQREWKALPKGDEKPIEKETRA